MTSSVCNLKLSSGYEIPAFGLGTWKSKPGEVTEAVKYAFEIGYRHIDCAALYENEKEVGIALKYAMEELKIQRSEIFITSKLWNTKHRPEDVEVALRETLSDLGLEYLDLYLIHFPIAFAPGEDKMPKNSDDTIKYNEECHPTNTWFEMEKLVGKGLVRSIGVSNFNSVQLQDILDRGTIKPVTNQIEVHPYLSQIKLIDYCLKRNVLVTAYSPLASPDRPWASPNDPKLLDEPKILDVAKKHGKSPAQIVLRWSLQRNCIVIPKSVNNERIAENFNIFDFTLDDDDLIVMSSLECNGRVVVGEMFKDHKHYPFAIEF